LELTGCHNLACVQNKSVGEMHRAMMAGWGTGGGWGPPTAGVKFGPNWIDGLPYVLMSEGKFKPDLKGAIIGATADESAFNYGIYWKFPRNSTWDMVEPFVKPVVNLPEKQWQEVVNLYFDRSLYPLAPLNPGCNMSDAYVIINRIWTEMNSNYITANRETQSPFYSMGYCSARANGDYLASHSSTHGGYKTFTFYFDTTDDTPIAVKTSSVADCLAPHMADVPFWSGATTTYGGSVTMPFSMFGNVSMSPQNAQLSKQMTAYLANFVHTGDPNGQNIPTWPEYTVAEKQNIYLKAGEVRGEATIKNACDLYAKYKDLHAVALGRIML